MVDLLAANNHAVFVVRPKKKKRKTSGSAVYTMDRVSLVSHSPIVLSSLF